MSNADRSTSLIIGICLACALNSCAGELPNEARGLAVVTGTQSLGDGARIIRCALERGEKDGLPVLIVAVVSDCDTEGSIDVLLEMQSRGTQRFTRKIDGQKLHRAPAENRLAIEHLLYPERDTAIWTRIQATCSDRKVKVWGSATCQDVHER